MEPPPITVHGRLITIILLAAIILIVIRGGDNEPESCIAIGGILRNGDCCGDGNCTRDEDQSSCCMDCGCPSNLYCINGHCISDTTIGKECELNLQCVSDNCAGGRCCPLNETWILRGCWTSREIYLSAVMLTVFVLITAIVLKDALRWRREDLHRTKEMKAEVLDIIEGVTVEDD